MNRILAVNAMFLLLSASAAGQPAGFTPAESRNMSLVGSSDLQGRPAYMPVIHRHGEHWSGSVGSPTPSVRVRTRLGEQLSEPFLDPLDHVTEA